MSQALQFAFAVHIHQPVGNFDHVFQEHVDEVYRPFLERTAARDFRPISLHVSGPLLDWLETNDARFLDDIGREVADGRIEMLGSGRTEPVLAALPRIDRIEQVEWMRDALVERFGHAPEGVWLTERVWEQDLAGDLAEAGIDYALLDDRHFLSVGLSREDLVCPFRTESDGRPLDLLPIDERLRYLIPFESAANIERFMRERQAEGTGLIVLGDDGEKFGGWPGTRQWVYGTGWLDDFLDAIERLRTDETVKLITTGEAAARDSGGLVYPAPGSYREMEGWALPRPAALELERLRDRSAFGADHPSIRGGHWRNFQSRYAVSNRMHKTALALSLLCRERGEPSAARAAIARGQCNDAYWHGVFGGVYLPHLRRGVWRELATAEGILRAGENMGVTAVDHDFDGHDEVWVHGPRCSAIVSPRRGGAIESLLRFDAGENDLDILERHFEAYHGDPDTAPTWAEVAARWSVVDDPTEASDEAGSASIASIHDREPPERPAPPAIDPQPPAMFREWIRRGGDGETTTTPVAHRLDDISVRPDEVTLTLSALLDGTTIRKRILVTDTGMIRMDLEWECPDLSDEATVWTEIWLAFARVLEPSLPVSEEREEVVTLARSEQGYEEIRQGEIVRYGWPAAAGRATVWISAPN